jgi:hypothetical protein
MRKAGGYACIITPDAGEVRLNGRGERPSPLREGLTEMDTFTCKHCSSVVHVMVRQRPEDLGGLCKQCMGLICPRCVGLGCTPFEKKLEMVEARGRALRSYGV